MQTPPRFDRAFVASFNKSFDYATLQTLARRTVPVFQKEIYPDFSDAMVTALVEEAIGVLRAFQPGADVLVLGGDPAAMALSSYLLGAMHAIDASQERGPREITVHLAKWDAKERGYYVIQF